MPNTVISAENRVKQYESKIFLEYIRKNPYAKFMGTDENAAIQINEKLGKMPGESISIPLMGEFKGSNKGTGILEGNETQLNEFNHTILVEVVREAFSINDFEENMSAFDVIKAGKAQMMNWLMDLLRTDINEALHARNNILYKNATAAQHDTWQVDNADRVIYVGTTPTGDHSADLATLAAGVDTFSADTLSLGRRKLRTGSPKVRPMSIDGTDGREESFVAFLDTFAFRDLVKDPAIVASRSDAMARGANNPLFKAGDVLYDGVVCIEVPELSNLIDDAGGSFGAGAAASGLNNAGAAGARVGVGFMMGAQAIGIAYAKRPKLTSETRDYDFIKGFGVREYRKVEKLLFQTGTVNKVDHGVCTMYAAAATD